MYLKICFKLNFVVFCERRHVIVDYSYLYVFCYLSLCCIIQLEEFLQLCSGIYGNESSGYLFSFRKVIIPVPVAALELQRMLLDMDANCEYNDEDEDFEEEDDFGDYDDGALAEEDKEYLHELQARELANTKAFWYILYAFDILLVLSNCRLNIFFKYFKYYLF